MLSWLTPINILGLFLILPAELVGYVISGQDVWGLVVHSGIF